MLTEQISFLGSIKATAAIIKNRFVGYTGAVCAAAQPAVGVADLNQDAGSMASVKVHGFILIETGGAINAGTQVESDASGRAVTLAAGVANGRALTSSTGAGQFILIKA